MCYWSMVGGLRSGEVHALEPSHLIRDDSAIVIQQQIDNEGSVTFPKGGTSSNPKHRVVRMPGRAWNMLDRWLEVRADARWLFHLNGTVPSRGWLLKRLTAVVRHLNFDPSKRLKVHSLRYTYRTRMEELVENAVLLELMGHEDDETGRIYSNPQAIERARALRDIQPTLDSAW